MKIKTSICSIAMFACLVATSYGQLMQPPNAVNGFFADISFPQAIADDIIVGPKGTTLTQLEWYGGYFPGNIVLEPDRFTIRIHDDAGGLPDGLAAHLDLSEVEADTRTDTGIVLFGVSEFFYTLDIGSVALPEGTYWVEIENNSAETVPEVWFWETGDQDLVNGGFDGAFAVEAPGVNWIVNAGPAGNTAWNAVAGDAKCAFDLGDVNEDGEVTLLDVQPFVDLLTATGFLCQADINGDGEVTLLDVDPFVVLLGG